MTDVTRSPRRAAFTLIELLVVITIISLLISILLPALAQAKKTAKMLVEQAAGNQMMTAYNAYSSDYKDGLIMPYVHWSWAHPNAGPIQHRPHDFTNNPVYDIEGDVVKPWPLRFMYYAGGSGGALPPEAMINDRAFLSSVRSRDKTPTNGTNGPTAQYDSTAKYQYAMAWHPSFGMNSVFVGGHYAYGAFSPNSNPGYHVGHPRTNHFYVSTAARVRDPSVLIVSATARSQDVSTIGRGSDGYGARPVGTSTATVPGYYQITPPRPTGITMGPIGGTLSAWRPENKFSKNTPATYWGFLDFRHFDKSITTHIDGHVELQTISQLRDMRKWSNRATNPDWNFQPGNH